MLTVLLVLLIFAGSVYSPESFVRNNNITIETPIYKRDQAMTLSRSFFDEKLPVVTKNTNIIRRSIGLSTVSPHLFMELVAGTSSSGYSNDNGPASSAQIQCEIPFVDNNGNIYIPDDVTYRIRKINAAGIITTFGGTGSQSTDGISGPIGSVSFYYPISIVGDSAGSVLYICDNRYVWKYVFSTNNASVYAHTVGAAVGYSGDNGPATSAKLDTPTGLWLTTDNVLYIADTNINRIRKVSSSGIITTVVGAGCSACSGSFSGDNGPATLATLGHPRGVYMDTNGKLFIADNTNFRIRVVDTNNIITTFAGSGSFTPFNGDNIPATSANLKQLLDVKGDSLGNIYFADSFYKIIRIVETDGIISTLFGTPSSGGYNIGIAPRTSFINSPYGIWIDSSATIYFSDQNSIHRGITAESANPTASPTFKPTQPTCSPTSRTPTTYRPSRCPTVLPTKVPTFLPTSPSSLPTSFPSTQPTLRPTAQPSQPTTFPSVLPTSQPSLRPTIQPSSLPTIRPSSQPTTQPSGPSFFALYVF
jgi:hypothetical protein